MTHHPPHTHKHAHTHKVNLPYLQTAKRKVYLYLTFQRVDKSREGEREQGREKFHVQLGVFLWVLVYICLTHNFPTENTHTQSPHPHTHTNILTLSFLLSTSIFFNINTFPIEYVRVHNTSTCPKEISLWGLYILTASMFISIP